MFERRETGRKRSGACYRQKASSNSKATRPMIAQKTHSEGLPITSRSLPLTALATVGASVEDDGELHQLAPAIREPASPVEFAQAGCDLAVVIAASSEREWLQL